MSKYIKKGSRNKNDWVVIKNPARTLYKSFNIGDELYSDHLFSGWEIQELGHRKEMQDLADELNEKLKD